jgi:hypothetical protein
MDQLLHMHIWMDQLLHMQMIASGLNDCQRAYLLAVYPPQLSWLSCPDTAIVFSSRFALTRSYMRCTFHAGEKQT